VRISVRPSHIWFPLNILCSPLANYLKCINQVSNHRNVKFDFWLYRFIRFGDMPLDFPGGITVYYTPRKQSLGVYRNHPVRPSVRPSVHVPCKRNSTYTTYWIFMKLYTFVVHSLQMCMKEYGCCPKLFKRRDNSTYTFTKRGDVPCKRNSS
jgi:hypothetical protein